MDKEFKQIYHSDDGYWRGKSVIQKLSKSSGSTKEEAEKWLLKQPLYQIYLPPPKYIPRPNASMSLFAKPNDIHQADILYLPHDKFKKKVYKYALIIVDVASRYKGSYQLSTKNTKEVAQAFQWIYQNMPLTYPKTLIIDDRKEFYGDTTKLMKKHDVMIQCGDPSQHRSHGIVERFNRTLADRLFSFQYHNELKDPSKSNREWVSRLLQNVVSAFNNEKSRLIGMKPVDAIKETLVKQGFSQPVKDYEEKLLDVGTKVRYLYEPGKLEGYQYKCEMRERSTDPQWSVDVYKIKDRLLQNVVSAFNNEKSRLIGMKPVDAIKETLVKQGFSQPVKDYEEKLLDVGTKVRYLYEPGKLEGYQYKCEMRERSTDPQWSVDVYKIKDRYVQKYQPTFYYLDGGPK